MVLKPGPRRSRGRVAKVGDTAHVAPKWYAHLACGRTTAGGGVWEGLQRDRPGGVAPALVLPSAATRWRTPLGPEARTANLWGQSPPQASRPGSALCHLPGAWPEPCWGAVYRLSYQGLQSAGSTISPGPQQGEPFSSFTYLHAPFTLRCSPVLS